MRLPSRLSVVIASALAFPLTVNAATVKPSGPPAWQIFAAVGAAYLVAWLATRSKPARIAAVRKAWNLALLVSFAVTGVTGAAVAFAEQFRAEWLWAIGDSDLHTLFGLAMIAIALFHASWHWSYFLSILKRRSAKPGVAPSP